MARPGSTAASDQDKHSTVYNDQRVCVSDAGFILLFTLWILAACGILLAIYGQNSGGAPKLIEAHLGDPLEKRQMYSVLDYVLGQMAGGTLSVDARWQTVREMQALEGTRRAILSGTSPVAQLKEILDQLGFSSGLPDDKELESRIAAHRTKLADIKVGETGRYEFSGQFAPMDQPYEINFAGTKYQLTVKPITAYPNLNTIPHEALERYLKYLGLTEVKSKELAAAIVDWRDENHDPVMYGAEDIYYFGLRPSYLPRNNRIQNWGELSFLKDGGDNLGAFLRKHFVLQGVESRVYASAFSTDALAVLTDLDVKTIERAISYIKNESNRTTTTTTLEQLVGSEPAKAVLGMLMFDRGGVDQPFILELEAKRRSIRAIFDPSKRELLDLYDG